MNIPTDNLRGKPMATIIFSANPPISDDDRGADRARWLRWSQLTLSPDDAAIVAAELARISTESAAHG
jgi:hypothetical protein